MARIQYGALVTAITGSIGGWTFQANRSGNIIRLRSSTRKTSTPLQTARHQSFVSLLSQWQDVSLANKALWDAFAIAWTKTNTFGDVKTLTGLNWYQSINYYQVLLGNPVLALPPVHTLPPAVDPFSVGVDETSIQIFFNPAFNPANSAIMIDTTYLVTRVTDTVRPAFRSTKLISAGPFNNIDITSDWETAHGISWPPGASPTNGVIFVMIRTLEKTSGIASTGLINSDSVITGSEGIGFWIIETDFIVQ